MGLPSTAFILLVGLASSNTSGGDRGGIDEADVWVSEAYGEALDLAFPFAAESTPRGNRDSSEWAVSVVVAPDGARVHDPERQFVLTKSPGGAVKLLVRRVVGARLGDQLADARRKEPGTTVARALAAVQFRETAADDSTCRPLRKLAGNLERISVPVLSRNVLVIHGTVYTIRIRTMSGDRDSVLGVMEDDANPLSRWIARVDAAARECTE